ncbi:hypothetical protein OG942_30835 [Streptomyces griseorubiginosus]|nr:hypothetical protein [Streptomyces griseorubiginosus]WUB47493.1 hypothetical protein OHN19_30825 [Streptomyces griseorubiginosus]WUB56018.1 hypothetical protein OG942_30835 [Streptomyces griseorubiginosus]
MTACAIEPTTSDEDECEDGDGESPRTEYVIAEDGVAGETPGAEYGDAGGGVAPGSQYGDARDRMAPGAGYGDAEGGVALGAETGDAGDRVALSVEYGDAGDRVGLPIGYGDGVASWRGGVPAGGEGGSRVGCVITVDGSYAARLALDGDCWFPERWTLDGPEPYAVPLPGRQPEEPGTEVHPMGDGRVLIRRFADGRHNFSLLYPTGPETGELPLGAVECPDPGTVLRLLPPAPGGEKAYALAVGRRSSAVWLVAGGAFGPEHLAEIPGRCSGGAWLDRAGRMLALDREVGGRTKTIVVDLERGGEVSPLLQIADDSDDRLLLADPDSGLLLISSDAPSPGRPRLGWGVLGSTLPVRFPECLRVPDCAVTPFAIQPGQILMPESCGVALRIDGPLGSWVGVWRPAARQVQHLPAPEGWLTGAGLWTEAGELLLPYATEGAPCGVTRWAATAGPLSGETGSRGEDAGSVGGEVESVDDGESGPVGGNAGSVDGEFGSLRGQTGPLGGDAGSFRGDAGSVGGDLGSFGPGTGSVGGEFGSLRGQTGSASWESGPVGREAGPLTGAPRSFTEEAQSPRDAGAGETGTGDAVREDPYGTRSASEPAPPGPVAPRPVPLQQAPLGNLVTK